MSEAVESGPPAAPIKPVRNVRASVSVCSELFPKPICSGQHAAYGLLQWGKPVAVGCEGSCKAPAHQNLFSSSRDLPSFRKNQDLYFTT